MCNLFSQAELDNLYDIIAGRGKYSMFGGGLHTYPNRSDNDKFIYAACLELEKTGRIRREIDGPNYVLWGVSEILPNTLLGYPIKWVDGIASLESEE